MNTDAAPPKIAARLLRWYDAHGRKDLPWQRARDAYRVWLAEVMLQQTQVATVLPYYRRFLRRFPTIRALAAADVDEVLRHFAGLGYYARARNLHAAAKQIVARHGGEFPAQFAAIAALPGVGRSTAGAIAAFAFNQRRAILDGNVKRVFSRYFALDGDPAASRTQARLWQIAQAQLPRKRVADYNQALMDLGATVCTRAKPKCEVCPLAADCLAHRGRDPTAYPTRKRRPARRRKAVTMLVIRRGGHVLLVRRPPHGIWGGLWSLPEYPHRGALPQVTVAHRRRLQAWCARAFGLRVTVGDAHPAFTHAFTHFDLDIRALLATCATAAGDANMDGARHVWYKPSSPATRGLPAAVAKIFSAMKDTEE